MTNDESKGQLKKRMVRGGRAAWRSYLKRRLLDMQHQVKAKGFGGSR